MKGYFRKRGDKWSFTIDLGRDANNKRKQKTQSGFKTKKEAQHACNKLINELMKGEYVEPSQKTVEEILLEFMTTHGKHAFRQKTYETHMYIIQKHIIPSLGHVKVPKLTPAMVQGFYLQKLQDENYSAEYVRTMHAVLRKAFNKAVKWQYINKSIIELVDPPRLEAKEIRTWTLEDATTFLEYVKGKRFYIVFLLAIYTGMRQGEILGLRWKDCHLKDGNISVTQTLSRTAKGLIFQEPKTRGSKRLISIPKHVTEELKQHKKEQNEQKILLGPAYEDYNLVACIETGKPIDARNLIRYYKRMIKESGVPDIRFHDLRHTHATIMLQLGEHPKVVSERLGHSKTNVTLDIYSHVVPDMQKSAADKFEQAMRSVNNNNIV
ncbi:tyrosine-type recombinase/integrase [Alkalihalobacillus sp. BA299]|uniref:site-specific integrase n=1 Tax=Alkalihalobacillus sp. BA299 TaxID=2815938 RepID=UPI001AD98793|nr:tyrosine-type recombinase/integrase [Alkalihalobacillus sp. BA299]